MEFRNKVLSKLSADELAHLRLEPVDLPRGRLIEQSGRSSEHVYFLDHGAASVVAAGGGIELGMIGSEGMTGLAVVMGAKRAPYDTVMQVAGKGVRARMALVQNSIHAKENVRRAVLDYVQVFLTHVAAGAVANARNTLVERLARWLVIAQDRILANELRLTHDLVAQILGVRRAGVTLALGDLQDRGLINCHRGTIKIINRAGLIAASDGAYQSADEIARGLRPPESSAKGRQFEPAADPNTG